MKLSYELLKKSNKDNLMNNSNTYNENHILLDLKSSNKRQLLSDISNKISALINLENSIILDALSERENLGSTGFGYGSAIPHARISGLQNVKAFFVKLDTPIAFDAIDNKPVDLLFVLLSPEGNGADHLTALASASRILKDETLCKKIRNEKNSEIIYALTSM